MREIFLSYAVLQCGAMVSGEPSLNLRLDCGGSVPGFAVLRGSRSSKKPKERE